MADYPLSIYSPSTLVDGSDYPQAAHVNLPNAEIVALETALGVSPTSIDDTVSPGASPASVAVYLDMVANILKTMSGQSNWYDADVQLALASQVKGRVEFIADIPPATSGATRNVLAGASTPAEQHVYLEFPDAAATYHDYVCRLVGYNGGGLTFTFEVLRTSASAGNAYVFQGAIRRINAATENLGSAHTYDYNTVTVTVPAGPPAAGIPMQGTITFTDGADMDSLANNELFIFRFLRDPAHANDNAGDTARVLISLTGRET